MSVLRTIAAAASALALTLTACSSPQHPVPVTQVELDLTGSASPWRAGHLKDLAVVLDVVAQERGRVVVKKIDASSQAHGVVVADVSFAGDDGGNSVKRDRLVAAARKQVTDKVARLYAEVPPSKGSDLFGALVGAGQDLAQYPPEQRSRIVLLSDMVNTVGGRRFNLARGDWCAAANRSRLVADLRADGLLPDLRGVDVWVGGAGLTAGDGMSPREIQCLRGTWLAVLAASGASTEQYGTTLVDPGRNAS